MNSMNRIKNVWRGRVKRKKAFVAAAAVLCVIAVGFVVAPRIVQDEQAAMPKKEMTESGDVVAPEITADAENDAGDGAEEGEADEADAGKLVTDTAPKPNEGKEIEYSIQKPNKVKEQ